MTSPIVEFELPDLLNLGWVEDAWQMPEEALIVDSLGHTIGQISLTGLKTGEVLYLQAVELGRMLGVQ